MSLRADTAWMGESCVKALGETLLKLTALDLLTMALLFFDLESVQAVRTFAYHTAYQLLIGQEAELEPIVDTSTQIVNRSNLFSLDSQKALFAFEQQPE